MLRIVCSLLIPLSSLLLSQLAVAEIYKTVDKDGNVIYTDQAPAGSKKTEKIELKPSNTLPAVKTPAANTSPAESEEQAKPFKYTLLRITSPEDDSAIEHGPGNFTVTAKLKPELKKGHSIQLYIDGEAYGSPGTSNRWALKNVFRGTHVLQVKVLNANGKTVKKSKKTSVHVFRPSVLHPGNRG